MLSGHASQLALYPGLFSYCYSGMGPQTVVPQKRVFRKPSNLFKKKDKK